MGRLINNARELAAAALAELGRNGDAAIVRAGGGDDFPEVRAAAAALSATGERTQLLERALRYYADEDLWEGEVPDAALAFYDRGEVARGALAGKDLLSLRD